MSAELSHFIETFVLPLLGGGTVLVGAPVRPREREEMAEDSGELGLPQLRYLRLRRAQQLAPDPVLPDPDVDELSLWIGLHNTLVFDHPDRRRVWARAATWRRLEGSTRTLLTLPSTTSRGEGLARHVTVGAFVDLQRTDTIVATATGELRFLGQHVPRRRLRLSAVPQTGHRQEIVPWLTAPHAPETERLIEDAMRTSPLTCLLHPRRAPPGWSPLLASDFLRDRGFARSVVYTWARDPEWVAVGGAVMSALLPSLPLSRPRPEPEAGAGTAPNAETPEAASSGARALAPRPILALPGAVVPTSPEALSAVVGALIHLHFLKVLELEARLGAMASGRDPGTLGFLALPLVLPSIAQVTGSPLPGLEPGGLGSRPTPSPRAPASGTVARRWVEYLDHLEELVPRRTIDNLLAALVPRIVT